MSKDKVSEWSSTAANNSDVGGINIAEGMAPSGVNNAMREIMAQIKDMQAGYDGDDFTVGGTLNVETIAPKVDIVVISATSGVKVPVGTTAQRPTGANGFIRYNTDLDRFEGYRETAWGAIGGGATGGGTDEVFQENGNTVNTSYTITTNKNAISAGDITIGSAATVTVPTGSRWVIV